MVWDGGDAERDDLRPEGGSRDTARHCCERAGVRTGRSRGTSLQGPGWPTRAHAKSALKFFFEFSW